MSSSTVGGSSRQVCSGLVDFKKAFDSMQHDAIWSSLRNHSISEQYI